MLLRRNLFTSQQWNVLNIHTKNFQTNKKSFYDVLEISSKATKNDIKKSYYRLSLLYHPDHNKDDEKAANKFREITEAYEILGDVAKRRMYDKGLHGFGGASDTVGKTDEGIYSKYYTPSKKAPSVGRTGTYDFDAWTRFHYQSNFERSQRERKEKMEFYEAKRRNEERRGQPNSMISAFVMSILALFFLSIILQDEDKPKPPKR